MDTAVSHSEFLARLLSRFKSVVIGATGASLNSTTYSSSETGSSRPASFPNVQLQTMHEIQQSMKSATILDDKGRPDFKLLDELHLYCDGALTKETVYKLRSIAEAMSSSSSGQLFECITMYAEVRKSFLHTIFKRLRFEKLNIKEVRMLEWNHLELKIKLWRRAAKLCLRILFPGEKRQFEQIFGGLQIDTVNAWFVKTVWDATIQLFDIAEALSMIRPSPERLKTILLFYEDLSKLMLDFNYVFPSESVENFQIRKSIQIYVAPILTRLEETMRVILPDFEKAVLHELSTVPDAGGRIHNCTKYVMDYVRIILENKEILTKLIVSKPSTNVQIPDVEYAKLEGTTPLALHLIWIIVILRFNLESKSKNYVEPSLAHLFMMNNVDYIVCIMEQHPELQEIIGDDYLKKLAEDIQHSANSYQKLTLDRILHCLRDYDEPKRSWLDLVLGMSNGSLRRKLKTFNSLFEKVHHTQARWAVPNSQLRKKLRLSILEKLISHYKSFLERHNRQTKGGKHRNTNIKYSVKDLETAVMNFFAH